MDRSGCNCRLSCRHANLVKTACDIPYRKHCLHRGLHVLVKFDLSVPIDFQFENFRQFIVGFQPKR